jgi:geranylgeranyl diphosphate synthase type II
VASLDTVPQAIRKAYDADREVVEARLSELLDTLAGEHQGMREAMGWSLLGGGKRLRPLLCMWTHDMVGGKRRAVALDAACAIECVHTYSLIHDDLPCMDDDDVRRGKASSHKQFGQATAVLAGDALLTLAFVILSTIPERLGQGSVEDTLEMIKVLSHAAGTGGLVTGQALDLSGSARSGDLEGVRRIHKNKTARLIAAAVEVGAVAGGVGETARARIREAGLLAGEAFQITDDVLDCREDAETLGKTPGKDARSDKLTFPAVVGVERSREEATLLIGSAASIMTGGGIATDREGAKRVLELFAFIVSRGA